MCNSSTGNIWLKWSEIGTTSYSARYCSVWIYYTIIPCNVHEQLQPVVEMSFQIWFLNEEAEPDHIFAWADGMYLDTMAIAFTCTLQKHCSNNSSKTKCHVEMLLNSIGCFDGM